MTTTAVRRWTRSQNKLLAGVCAGIAEKFGLEPWMVRLLWLVSILLFGTGLLAYFILAITWPREEELWDYDTPKVFGVCHYLSHKTGVDLALIRSSTVFIGLASLGTTILAYAIAALIIPKHQEIVKL